LENVIKLIVFRLKNERYGVDLQQVRSIERLQRITVVPQTPSFIKGVINLRGQITPVLDLNERLYGEQTSHTDETRILITQIENIQVGLIVDAATDVLDVNSSVVEPAQNIMQGTSNVYVKGVAKIDNELLILLDLERVMSIGEIAEIADGSLAINKDVS